VDAGLLVDTAIDTMTDLVNVKRESNIMQDAMLLSFPRFCMVHTVDRFGSEWWFSCDQMIFLMCFVCFW